MKLNGSIPQLAEDSAELQNAVAEAFLSRYQGATFLIKVGGAEIKNSELKYLIEGIRDINQRANIKTVLALGGGPFIDDAYSEKHVEGRPKSNGIGVTTPEVMRDGVLPAIDEVKSRVTGLFSSIAPNLCIKVIDSDDVSVRIKDADNYGLVGEVEQVNGIDEDVDVNIVPFVGRDVESNSLLNVNADEIFRHLAGVADPARAFVLTEAGGVRYTDGSIVPIMTVDVNSKETNNVSRVLEYDEQDIFVDGGMRKKLLDVKKVLEILNRVTIISARGFIREVLEVEGHGTMIIRKGMYDSISLKREDYPIFQQVYAKRVKDGTFRERTQEDFEEAMRHHKILKIDTSVLGGYSLIPRGDSDAELACLWAGNIRNGVGGWLLADAMNRAKVEGRQLWAITGNHDAREAFNKAKWNWRHLPRIISGEVSTKVPDFVRNYDPKSAKHKTVFTTERLDDNNAEQNSSDDQSDDSSQYQIQA